MKGGLKKTKSQIMKQLSKNRMLSKSIAIAGGRRRMTRRMSRRSSRRNKRVSRHQRGGMYQQYGSNVPNTPTYSTGGTLSASESALANPIPYKLIGGTANCYDNYNHYTGKWTPTM